MKKKNSLSIVLPYYLTWDFSKEKHFSFLEHAAFFFFVHLSLTMTSLFFVNLPKPVGFLPYLNPSTCFQRKIMHHCINTNSFTPTTSHCILLGFKNKTCALFKTCTKFPWWNSDFSLISPALHPLKRWILFILLSGSFPKISLEHSIFQHLNIE